MKRFFVIFLLLFVFPFAFAKSALATILFQDDFSDGEVSDWTVEYLTPSEGNSNWDNSKWKINSNGEYGISFTNTQMRTISFVENTNFSDYIYTFQLIGKSGTDKNIIFHYKDKNNWYNFHLRDDGIRFGIMKDGNYSDNNGEKLSEFSLINNVVYSLEIIVDNSFVSLLVDGQPVIENLEIFDDFISEGKIALYASTGDFSSYTSIYFDNIVVCTLDDPHNCNYPEEYFYRSPIILIPGHGASINFKEMFLYPNQDDPEGWQMMPGVHVYDNLINTLEDNGYEKDKDLFTFYYNWLSPIASSSAKLHDFVLPIIATSSTGKVDIIGHSMGGLVGRACVQNNNEDHCFVDHLITVGTPHKGVLETYGAWEGGEVWRSGLSKLAFELFLNAKRQLGETKKETIRRLAPSTEEMLPVFSYFKNITGGELPFDSSSYPQNKFLSGLPPLSNLSNAAKVIYGQNYPTLRWLTIDKNLSWVDKILGNWEYGKPIKQEYINDGDGTVLALSAYPEASLSAASFDFNHSEVVSKNRAVKKIMESLDLEATSSGDFKDNVQDYLAFYLHSPAHLEIANLPAEDVFLGEDEGGKLRLVIIANPQIGDSYSVNVVGDDNGEYTLTVGEVSGGQSNWDNYRGLTTVGEKDTFLIKFDPTVGQVRLFNVQSSVEELPVEELPLDELIAGLKEIFTIQSEELAQKMDNLESLISISPEKAWEYVYQIRNLTASLYKSGQINLDIQKVNSQLDNIAVYLRALAKNEPRVLANNETELNFQDAQEIVDNLTAIPYSDIEHLEEKFSLPAAFDFSLAQKSLEEASKSSYPAYLLSRKSYFLGRNSKALIQ